jgi:hypothetical protein
MSSYCTLKTPVADIGTFDGLIRSPVVENPFGCTSWNARNRNHPPVQRVREMYTAKFEYRNGCGKRIGTTIEMYYSVEGYETGVAAVISNMANIAFPCGKVRHIPYADLFSAMLRCHDPNGEVYFLSIARNRVTVSSYTDNRIRKRVEKWTDGEPALA